LGLAIAHAPSAAPVGLSHGDFCQENIVLRGSGTIAVIDNETLSIDAYDRDLVRTWYLWSMIPAQQEAYYDGYNRFRKPADFVKDFPYWAIDVLVASAAFRLRTGRRDALAPIRKLRTIAGHGVQDGNSLRGELLMGMNDA
jgi:aminoglycoside phosphotransferase (APT) family kinase protein